jgi:hypothetical protein
MSLIVNIDRAKQTITLTMPLQKACPSKSTGKTLVIASTHGCQMTDARRLGRPVVVTANAFVYADARQDAKPRKAQRNSSIPVERKLKAIPSVVPKQDERFRKPSDSATD